MDPKGPIRALLNEYREKAEECRPAAEKSEIPKVREDYPNPGCLRHRGNCSPRGKALNPTWGGATGN